MMSGVNEVVLNEVVQPSFSVLAFSLSQQGQLQPPTLQRPMPVTNNTAENRFELEKDGHLAILDYIRAGEHRIAYVHTEVPRAVEGQGLGTQLIEAALDFARENNLKVIPSCPFVAAYFQEHKEVRDLLA